MQLAVTSDLQSDGGPLRRFGPGEAHLHELMRYAISRGPRYFDLIIGDYPYKLGWADETFNLLYDHVAAARWSGLVAAAEMTLPPRAKRLLKKSPVLYQLARRFKSVVRARKPPVRRGSSV